MKNLKKVLALVIALTMVLSTVAFASYADVDYEADYAGAVELLSALNVLKGDENGNFNPDNTITRAEFAAVVCRCLGLESSASSAAGATAFTDVAADHWAAGYVNLATQYGIINGRGNGIFDPNGNVTFAEAVKMLVVAIGYEPMAATKGGYPTGYLTVANSTKMTAGVSASGANAAALRSTVAQLAANALEIPKMDQVGFGSDTSFEVFDDYDNYASLLTAMDVFKLTGVITDIKKTEDEVTVKYTQGSDDYEFGYAKNGNEVDGLADGKTVTFGLNGSNAADFAQKNVDVYVKKVAKGEYDILFVVPSEIGETLVINGEDLNPDKAKVKVASAEVLEYKETKNSTKFTKFDVKANAAIYINGQPATYTDGAFDLSEYATKIEFVENTDDDAFDIINITVYEHAIVEEVDAAKERISFVDSNSIRFDSEDDEQVVDIYNAAGEKIALEDIKAGDVLAMVVHGLRNGEVAPARNFAANGNEITIYNLGANTVTGVITEADEDEDLVYIDGTEYEVEADFVDGNEDDVKLGTEGTFFLSIAGSIIGFDGTAGGNVNYAYVLQAAYNDGDAFSAGWQVKMLTVDGEVATYDLYKNITVNGADSAVPSDDIGDPGLDEGGRPITPSAEEAFFQGYKGSNAFKTTKYNNVVEYKLATDGRIKEIKAVEADDDDTELDSAFNAVTNKLGGKLLADDVVIFDLTGTDAEDVKVADLSLLVDDGEYKGYVFNNEDRDGFKIFVMTEGAAKFDPEVKYNVVSSVRSTTYDGDDAVIIKYFTEGVEEELSAIFTADLADDSYDDLSKGDVFVANVDADGVVSDYFVLATVDATNKTFVVDADAFAAAYGTEYDNNNLEEGVAYMVADFIEVKNGVAYFGNEDTGFKISAGAAAYNYTENTTNTRILEVGEWQGTTVDKKEILKDEDGNVLGYRAAKVFIKLYDGEVTDIYGYNEMKDYLDAE